MILIVSSIKQHRAGGYFARVLAAELRGGKHQHQRWVEVPVSVSGLCASKSAFLEGVLYSGFCKELVDNQLTDSSLIGLASLICSWSRQAGFYYTVH